MREHHQGREPPVAPGSPRLVTQAGRLSDRPPWAGAPAGLVPDRERDL